MPVTSSPPAGLKACCAAAYEQDWVAMLLGDSYHPGGEETTRRLARALDLRPGTRVLDVAAGGGSSALLLAREFGVEAIGIDRSAALTGKAQSRAEEAGLSARFLVGDGEVLPLANGSVDAVICECALCTFPDKAAGVSEMARVVRPGGAVGISDVTIERGRLELDLDNMALWVACLAGAEPAAGYVDLLTEAGLRVTPPDDCRDALMDLLDTIEPRLLALSLLNLPSVPDISADEVRGWMSIARGAVATGAAGYCQMTAVKPA